MEELSLQLAAVHIIEAIENENCYHVFVAGEKQTIHFCQKEIQYLFCLRSGEAELRRLSDDTVVANLKAPDVIGLTLRQNGAVFHYLKMTQPTELLAIKHE